MGQPDITYPHVLQCRVALALWRWLFCRGGWHLLDAVWTIDREYLICDACHLEVQVSGYNSRWQRLR